MEFNFANCSWHDDDDMGASPLSDARPSPLSNTRPTLAADARASDASDEDDDGEEEVDEATIEREAALFAAEHGSANIEQFKAQARKTLSLPKAQLRETLPMIAWCLDLARKRLDDPVGSA